MQRQQFEAKDFDVDEYIRSVAPKEKLTSAKLKQERAAIVALQEETSKNLRSTVYRHHARYIHITKDVAQLESDIAELGHLMHEESRVINTLVRTLQSGLTPAEEQPQEHKYTIADVNGLDRYDPLVAGPVLYQGQLLLSQLRHSYTDLPVHVFLFKNGLVIAKKEGGSAHMSAATSRSPLTLISIEPLHACHVETLQSNTSGADDGCIFNVLGRENYLFKARTQVDLRKWLRRLSRAMEERSENPVGSSFYTQPSFAESWLLESPETLESMIAQRLFTEAVHFYIKATGQLTQDGVPVHDPALASVEKKLSALKTRLSVSLSRELDRPALGRSVVRSSVGLLLQINELDKAREKYLEHWSGTLKREFRNLRVEGSTEQFVRKLTLKFFSVCKTTAAEFSTLFKDAVSQSAFVTWVNAELQHFSSIFSRQVFDSKTNTFSTITESVNIVQTKAGHIQQAGLDLGFLFWVFVQQSCCEAIEEASQSCVSSVANQLIEDPWELIVFGGKSARKDFVNAVLSAGIEDPDDLIDGMTAKLFRSTLVFCGEIHGFVTGCSRIYNTYTGGIILKQLRRLFTLITQKMFRVYDGNAKFKQNIDFLLGTVFTNAQSKLEESFGGRIEELHKLGRDLSHSWRKIQSEEGISRI